MNYEIAKQLKDKGFIFSKKRELLGMYFKVYAPANGEMLSSDYELIPSLEELIEACLKLFPDKYEQFRLEYWLPNDEWEVTVDDLEFEERGKTPEEAVAKLWLELNK